MENRFNCVNSLPAMKTDENNSDYDIFECTDNPVPPFEQDDAFNEITDEDCELQNLLAKYKLENYFNYLNEQHITLNSLRYINETDLKEIFEGKIGTRATFRALVNEWRLSNNVPPIACCTNNHQMVNFMHSSQREAPRPSAREVVRSAPREVAPSLLVQEFPTSPVSDMQPTTSTQNADDAVVTGGKETIFNMEQFLVTNTGRFLKKKYNRNQNFTPDEKDLLATSIVREYITKNAIMMTKDFEEITKEISKVFRNESREYYFKKLPKPNGKLYNKYRTLSASFKKSGFFTATVRSRKRTASPHQPSYSPSGDNITQTHSEPSVSYDSEEIGLLLSSWGFSQEVIRKVTDLKLSIWHLQMIEDSDIDALFPTTELVERIKFKYFLKEWRSKDNQTRCETPLSNISSRAPSESSDEEFLSLSNILRKNIKGKKIIEEYKEKNYLTEDYKKILVDVIAEFLITLNKPVNLKVIDKLSDEITNLFPSESKGTYYTARRMGGNPKGKLYDRFKNLKYTLARKGLFTKRKAKASVTTTTSNDFTLDGDLSTTCDDENITELQTWLKYNVNENNWSEALEKWKTTVMLRNRQCFQMNFLKLIEEWPLFKHPRSFDLINIDFGYMFPEKEHNLFLHWDKFKNNVIELFERDLKDRNSIEQLKELKEATSENHRNYLVINLLHGIIKPTVRLQKPDKKLWKPSIIDSQYSQILRLSTISDLQQSVEERKEKYSKFGFEVQPFIIIIDNCCEYYVWTQGISHKFSSFIKCLDCCFKIYQCFNFKYPRESELVWLFIQKYLYKIDTQYDIDCPHVISIISSLSSL